MKLKLIFVYLLFLISCDFNHQSKNKSILKKNDIFEANVNIDTSLIKYCVYVIESSETLDYEYIGIDNKSNVYSCFQTLLKILPDSTWVEFSKSVNPIMRCYSYEALLRKQSSNIDSVKERLLKDTSVVIYCSGDCSIPFTISDYVKNLKVKPLKEKF